MSNKNPKIVVIEDDRALADTLRDFLELLGYDAKLIHDGESAIRYLKHNTPDLVILDMHLPEIMGMDILHFSKGKACLMKRRLLS